MQHKSYKNDATKIRIQRVILGVGIILLIIKFIAYFITHSNAILSDALESIVNIVAGAFGLFSLILAAKPKDEDHPYGHGKIEFISASVEGGLIMMAGLVIIVKSIFGLIHPLVIQQIDTGLFLVALTALVNYIMGHVAEIKGKQMSSLALTASGRHLKTDTISTGAIIIGLVLIRITGIWWLDSIIALLMGAWIIYTGISILRKSVAGIMDEADFDTLNIIIENLNRNRRMNWVDIHNLRLIRYGAHLHIDCHTTLPWYFSLVEAHEEVKAIEDCFHENMPDYLEAFIHADPCLPVSCPSCIKTDCMHRQADFRQQLEWKLENVLTNSKHILPD